MTGIQLTLNRKTSRFIQALWYNIRVEREYLEVSLTGPKVWPVFGKAKPQNILVHSGFMV